MQRRRDVARVGINRLHLAPVPGPGAGVEQGQRGLAETFLELFGAEHQRSIPMRSFGKPQDDINETKL